MKKLFISQPMNGKTDEEILKEREEAVKQAEEASASARTASVAAIDAQRAAQDCASGVSAIVAGNEAYTKRESDLQYGPAIILSVKGAQICI